MNIEVFFGNLIRSENFGETYVQMINDLKTYGIEEVVKELIAHGSWFPGLDRTGCKKHLISKRNGIIFHNLRIIANFNT
ncbi:MAG: hypothetical protein KAS29_13320 [Bacteroidales bacterium]|nr:hypothetical protein [Bacteroidales bacterium]